MTSRKRWLAALDLQPVDRLPFWPKLDGAYVHAWPGRDIRALHEWMGSDPHEGVPGTWREVRRSTGASLETAGSERVLRFETPHGALERVDRFDAASQSWHPMRFPVRTAADVAAMRTWYEDCRVEPDAGLAEQAQARVREIGEAACTMAGIGESPLMEWVEWLAGVERAHTLLADAREDVEALFEAMIRVLRRRAEVLCETCPADLLYLVENTSTTLVSPEQYRRYCLPWKRELAGLASSSGRRLALHMCGHLKALLPDLAQVGARAFEAFTSPPVGNATLADGRRACPEVCLIGGTNAWLWTRPAGQVVAELERHLGELPHHRGIVVTSGGVMPPMAAPETIREVCRWVQAYPVRV